MKHKPPIIKSKPFRCFGAVDFQYVGDKVTPTERNVVLCFPSDYRENITHVRETNFIVNCLGILFIYSSHANNHGYTLVPEFVYWSLPFIHRKHINQLELEKYQRILKGVHCLKQCINVYWKVILNKLRTLLYNSF